jgi:predicted aspartyl protease
VALTLGVALLLLLAPSFASGEEGVLAELPFLDPLEHDGPLYPGHVRIDLSPRNRRPFPMLLDTGAQGTVMTPLYARALRVSVRKHKSDEYRRSTVVGRDVQFRVDTRSSESRSRTGHEYGLLGGDFLEAYVLEVDYQRKRVRFLDPDVWEVSEGRAEPGEWILPMGMTDGRPTLEIELGSGRANFLMDTGAPLDLMISEKTARRLQIEIPADAAKVMGQNVLAQDLSASFFVPEVRVGDEPTSPATTRRCSATSS